MALSTPADHRLAPPDRTFKLIAVVAAVGLVAFIVFVAVRGPSHSRATGGSAALTVPAPPVLKAGTVAPAFSLPRLGGGAPVSLASYRGTPVVLNFFASWCSDCRAELSAVATVARQSAGQVAVVGVDSNDTSTAAAQLLAQAGATYPVAVDAQARVATAYLLSALPVTYFVDGQGRVVGATVGPQTVASLDRWVSRLTGSGS
jgi:cytochrome c biogenesis protein CcmG/thiol:disulfide interchange protein DsbE